MQNAHVSLIFVHIVVFSPSQRAGHRVSALIWLLREVPKTKKQLAREAEEKSLVGLQKSAKKDLFTDDRWGLVDG